MSKVYSVAQGTINEYEITKETNCFYFIENNLGYKDRLKKEGYFLNHRFGGNSLTTTDILKASEEARIQLNTIAKYLAKEQAKILEAEGELWNFIEKNLAPSEGE